MRIGGCRDWEVGAGERLLHGCRVSFWFDKNVLELEIGGGYVTLGRH